MAALPSAWAHHQQTALQRGRHLGAPTPPRRSLCTAIIQIVSSGLVQFGKSSIYTAVCDLHGVYIMFNPGGELCLCNRTQTCTAGPKFQFSNIKT